MGYAIALTTAVAETLIKGVLLNAAPLAGPVGFAYHPQLFGRLIKDVTRRPK